MAFEKETDRRFVAQLTDNQGSLFSFLVGILGNVHDAQDALQETNLLLLSKMANFEEGTNFGAWSRSCARFVALSQIRDRGRDPHIFGEEVALILSNAALPPLSDGGGNDKLIALRGCVKDLSPKQQALIEHRYSKSTPLRLLASESGKSEASIKMALMRIRDLLRNCIRIKLTEQKR